MKTKTFFILVTYCTFFLLFFMTKHLQAEASDTQPFRFCMKEPQEFDQFPFLLPAVEENKEVSNFEFQITITGNAFIDENFNGIRDATESGIAGANVYVRGPSGFSVFTETDANGYFSVTGPAGFYEEIGVGAPNSGPFCWDGFGYYAGLGYAFEVINDVFLNFAFTPGEDLDFDTRCDYTDCKDTDPTILAPGDPCDDNDPSTGNDTLDDNCKCEGTPLYCTISTSNPSTIKLKEVYINGSKVKKNKVPPLSSGNVSMSYSGKYPSSNVGPLSGAVYVDHDADGTFDQTVLSFYEPSPDPASQNAGEIFVSGNFTFPLTGNGAFRVVLKYGTQVDPPCGDFGDADFLDIFFTVAGQNSIVSSETAGSGILATSERIRLQDQGYQLLSRDKTDNTIISYLQPVSENNGREKISVFPNPAKQILNIDLGVYENKRAIVRLYNSQGTKVLEKIFDAIPAKEISLHTAMLSSGVYYLTWDVEGQPIASRKIVISN